MRLSYSLPDALSARAGGCVATSGFRKSFWSRRKHACMGAVGKTMLEPYDYEAGDDSSKSEEPWLISVPRTQRLGSWFAAAVGDEQRSRSQRRLLAVQPWPDLAEVGTSDPLAFRCQPTTALRAEF